VTTRTFKGFNICDKHGNTYHWRDGCKKCQKERPMKKLDEVLKQMQEDGLIPKVDGDGKNNNDNN